MSTMEHYENTRLWAMTVVGIAVMVGLYAWIGDDEYQAAVRIDELRQARAASLAVRMCLPRGGQQTLWYWEGAGAEARLHCRVSETADSGRAPRTVMVATPAGLDRLALYAQGGRP